MAENYKHLYEQTKKMLTMYQDELIPGFRKKIEELEAKVATDNNVGSKWIPVTERVPEKRKAVLCFCTNNDYWVALWDICDDQLWSDGEWWRCKDFVTHWMPLPEPPKGE